MGQRVLEISKPNLFIGGVDKSNLKKIFFQFFSNDPKACDFTRTGWKGPKKLLEDRTLSVAKECDDFVKEWKANQTSW